MRNPILFLLAIISFFISACSQPDLELVRLQLENKYRSVGQFDKSTLIATIYDKMQMGYIDVNGKVILPLGEYATYDFKEGVGIYSRYDKEKNSSTYYAIDKTGTVLRTFKGLNYLGKFENGTIEQENGITYKRAVEIVDEIMIHQHKPK